MRFHTLLPRGFSKKKMRSVRERYGLKGKLEIHHIVPREFKSHPVVKMQKYDVEESYNLIFMPSKQGMELMNIRKTRPIHSGGHIAYNEMVKYRLDNCTCYCDFLSLLMLLHLGVRGLARIPWRRNKSNF